MSTPRLATVGWLLCGMLLAPSWAQPAASQDTGREAGPAVEGPAGEDRALSIEELKRFILNQSEEIRALRRQLEEQSSRLQRLEQKGTAALPEAVALKTQDPNGAGPVLVDARSLQQPASRPAAAAQAAPGAAETASFPGPLRFSGDFRYRFDSITRPSRALPDGSTIPNAQNVRMRYRLRLNFDSAVHPKVNFHGQLATGVMNTGLSGEQDFAATIARHPFFINEAWMEFRPNASVTLQGGRVEEILADNLRFLFDDSTRFNGFNEKYVKTFKNPVLGVKRFELRAGQYLLSNPNVAVIRPGDPLARAGARIGSRGRAAQMFHQGFVTYQGLSEKWDQQWGADIQLYRNPNQIALSSTVEGVALIIEGGLGLRLSGPMTGLGNATTTPGGAIYTARNFQIARLVYSLNHKGIGRTNPRPLAFDVQMARNVGASFERDALVAALSLGRTRVRGDWRAIYLYAIKGANSLIAQFTDDDLGTGSGVNIRTHHLRFDLALAKGITWQSLVYMQKSLRSSGQFPDFFVPLGALTPLQIRVQQHLLFSF